MKYKGPLDVKPTRHVPKPTAPQAHPPARPPARPLGSPPDSRPDRPPSGPPDCPPNSPTARPPDRPSARSIARQPLHPPASGPPVRPLGRPRTRLLNRRRPAAAVDPVRQWCPTAAVAPACRAPPRARRARPRPARQHPPCRGRRAVLSPPAGRVHPTTPMSGLPPIPPTTPGRGFPACRVPPCRHAAVGPSSRALTDPASSGPSPRPKILPPRSPAPAGRPLPDAVTEPPPSNQPGRAPPRPRLVRGGAGATATSGVDSGGSGSSSAGRGRPRRAGGDRLVAGQAEAGSTQ